VDDAKDSEDSLRPDVVDCDLCPPEGDLGRGGGRRGGRLLMMLVSGYAAFVTGLSRRGCPIASPWYYKLALHPFATHAFVIVYS